MASEKLNLQVSGYRAHMLYGERLKMAMERRGAMLGQEADVLGANLFVNLSTFFGAPCCKCVYNRPSQQQTAPGQQVGAVGPIHREPPDTFMEAGNADLTSDQRGCRVNRRAVDVSPGIWRNQASKRWE